MVGLVEADAQRWITALRRSQDRLVEQVEHLDLAGLNRQSACAEWSVAQVLSHLGSQAEIFALLLEAGLAGTPAPPNSAFPPIWEAWNRRSPQAQVRDSIDVNEVFVKRIESLDHEKVNDFHVVGFGMDLDAVTLLRLRLSEHAIHSWDVAVAFEPTARIISDAVDLIVDAAAQTANRVGKATTQPTVVRINTRDPKREFALLTDGVSIEQWSDQHGDSTLSISAEALIRLIYGRLRDADLAGIELSGAAFSLGDLRAMFPGI
jgi:uncharacterized protein (TIGR03083 family)